MMKMGKNASDCSQSKVLIEQAWINISEQFEAQFSNNFSSKQDKNHTHQGTAKKGVDRLQCESPACKLILLQTFMNSEPKLFGFFVDSLRIVLVQNACMILQRIRMVSILKDCFVFSANAIPIFFCWFICRLSWDTERVCFPDVGCFSTDPPFHLLPLPWHPKDIKVHLTLVTEDGNYRHLPFEETSILWVSVSSGHPLHLVLVVSCFVRRPTKPCSKVPLQSSRILHVCLNPDETNSFSDALFRRAMAQNW